MALLALLAVGCSENENMSNPEIPVNAKPIQVGQRVQGVTRAVVTEGSSVTATVLMCDGATADWSGFTAVKKNTITDGALKARANVSTASFMAGTSAAVTLIPSLYYDHATNTTKSHLVAVAPDGIVGASGTVVTMKDVDGQQDVMYASAEDAGSETSPQTPALTFNHLTTQLSFEIKITEATGTGEWDNKAVAVKNISVLSAQLPQSVDAAGGAVSWSTPASLSVPNLTSVSLNNDFSKVGNPVMIKGEGTVKVDVTLAIGDADITITNVVIKNSATNVDLTTGIGESHLISLNVIEPSATTGGEVTVSAKATVTPWKDGASGSADVE